MRRREMMLGLGGSALAWGGAAAGQIPAMSPVVASGTRLPPGRRKYTNAAVERVIVDTQARIRDPLLRTLFANCYPNTLDTTVELGEVDGKPDTFVATGDIPALWLRDSAAQVSPYLPLCRTDKDIRRLVQGLIHRHARCIRIDPYANAFMHDLTRRTDLDWSQHDDTEMKPGVAERKWEIDSLCNAVTLAWRYWKVTGDATPFDEEWRAAMALVVRTFREQQRKDGDGPYRFQRASRNPYETLATGLGAPTRKVGLIHSGFRPSDDSCIYPFLVPANLYAVVSLRRLADMAAATRLPDALRRDALALAAEVEQALAAHGRMTTPAGEIWAYEVDGFGNSLFMDDANVPSLLSLPFLGACEAGDPLYRRTRAAVLSAADPYFYAGPLLTGVGSPHTDRDWVWPIALAIQAITSTDDREIAHCLAMIKTATGGRGFINESVSTHDAGRFSRSWFAWANSLFADLILDLVARKPHLLA